MNTLKINEVFYSIQGESTWAGLACVFVRLTGCHLRCGYCDTEYAFTGGSRMSFSEIRERVAEYPSRLVEITGGEPLAHPGATDLARLLLDDGYTVLVETSGAFDVSGLDPRVHRIMDLKCPGSGECEKNLWSNLDHLGPGHIFRTLVSARGSVSVEGVLDGDLVLHGSGDPNISGRLLNNCVPPGMINLASR